MQFPNHEAAFESSNVRCWEIRIETEKKSSKATHFSNFLQGRIEQDTTIKPITARVAHHPLRLLWKGLKLGWKQPNQHRMHRPRACR
jgi:hypothetical protein